MHSIKPVLYILGAIHCVIASAMIIPMLIDLSNNSEDWFVFFVSATITGFFGIFLTLSNRQEKIRLTIKQAILLTPLTWFSLSFFSCIPFYYCDLGLNFAQAFFEAVSGITTTGATVIVGLDDAPKGLLMWRALLQYFGGLGIIALALIILPALGVGGMQVFKNESFGAQDKHVARTSEVAKSLFMIYTLLCAACAFLYYQAGMDSFDAVTHAFYTVSNGGFANYDTSFGHFDDLWIDLIAIVFMLLGAMPFIVYYKMLGGELKAFWKDSQIRTFLVTVLVICIGLTIYVDQQDLLKTSVKDAPPAHTILGFLSALHHVTFNIVSIIATCGIVNTDYSSWGPVVQLVFFTAAIVGGCTGSTAGGIKIFRFQILFRMLKAQLNKLMTPHGVFRPQYNHKTLSDDLLSSVGTYFFIYMASILVGAIILSLTGLDFLTSLSSAPPMLANSGPALGTVAGPAGNYSSFTELALWTCSILMILGRLEILVVLLIFTPSFWRE